VSANLVRVIDGRPGDVWQYGDLTIQLVERREFRWLVTCTAGGIHTGKRFTIPDSALARRGMRRG
jgi:hypothetical protein